MAAAAQSTSLLPTLFPREPQSKKKERPKSKNKVLSQLKRLCKKAARSSSTRAAPSTKSAQLHQVRPIAHQSRTNLTPKSNKSKKPLLAAFYKEHLGVGDNNVTLDSKGTSIPHLSSTTTPIGASYDCPTTTHFTPGPQQDWKTALPSPLELYRQEFGKPDSSHSFTQEACGETILHFVLKSGFIGDDDTTSVRATHPLVKHLDVMRIQLSNYNFTHIRNIDTNWSHQKAISKDRSRAMMACLLHYNLDVSLLMRYLGNNYTAAHRDVAKTVAILREHNIEEYLIQGYIRVTTIGCPNKMVAETTRENAMKYLRGGNNPSIKRRLEHVMTTMNKEERNNFVIPLPLWMARFVPHLFFTPQHLLEKEGKKARQIFDAKYRYDADSFSVNMFTSTSEGTELDCAFGDVLFKLLTRVWNLRITHPDRDIVLHANDIKSCFRNLKHHPDVMGAFSCILGDFLFLQCSLTFGSDFSPANWEVVRRIAEKLAESLFPDKSLRHKHRQYLDRLKWKKGMGNKHATLIPAVRDEFNQGVLDAEGHPTNVPHFIYVDDDCYAVVYDQDDIEQAVATSIEAIFILLGDSNLTLRQDTVSFDKMEETMINYNNRLLGRVIQTRSMMVSTPSEYVQATVCLLRTRWHNRRQTYFIYEMEELAGRLGHIAETVPWLRFLMAHIYMSVAAALNVSRAHLINTRSDFRSWLKEIKRGSLALSSRPKSTQPTCPGTPDQTALPLYVPDCGGLVSTKSNLSSKQRSLSYNASTAASLTHKNRDVSIQFNKTLRHELRIVEKTLSDPSISLARPIGHVVKRTPSAIAHSDSCLSAAGGFSIEMGFYWYIEWPESIQSCTLRYVKNNKDNKLITINVLEYAALIINYMAATHYYSSNHNADDPYPTVQLYADNTTAEAWGKMKQCKTSMSGRALGRLQCSLMINNNVGITIAHVTTKDNVIADRISRIKKETNFIPQFTTLSQEFPQLKSCRRFHPPPELVSVITDALLKKKSFDPLEARNRLHAILGPNTTCASPNSPSR